MTRLSGGVKPIVILPAAMVYVRLVELFGVEEILVPNVGVREGIVLALRATFSVSGRTLEEHIFCRNEGSC